MSLTAEGLQIPTVEELINSIATRQRADIDPQLANVGDSVAGNIVANQASFVREGYEALQTAFDAINPDNAEGSLLDAVCALTGTVREPASPSTFSGSKRLTVELDDGAQVTKDVTRFSVTATPSIEFVATETVINNTGITTDVAVAAKCTTEGAIFVNAGTVTTIATPTAGINSVINNFDAIVGHDEEKDPALRSRRERELHAAGSTTLPALKAELLQMTNEDGNHPILSVTVLENTSDTIDLNGLPAHSFEVVIWDGVGEDAEDADVIEIITANRPPGVKATGSIGTAPHQFTRAGQQEFDIEITLRRDATAYAGDDAVETAAALRWQELLEENGPVDDQGNGGIPFSAFYSSTLGVAGVNSVQLVRLRWTVGPGAWISNTDLKPDLRNVGVTDSSNVTVLSSVGP